MAEQMSPEEIQRVFAEYNETLKTGGTVSTDLANRMKDASKGVKGYADAQANLTKVLTKSVVDIGKAMYEGKQGAEVFAKEMSNVTDAIAGLMAVISVILPVARIFKIGMAVAAGAIGVFGKAAAEAAKQQDQLFKTYQEMSRSGMATAQGMSEVFPTMQKFGYGLEELDKMVALVRENSRDLARFSPNVAQGIQQVAGVASAIQHSGLQGQFMRMGMSVDDINKGIAGYAKQQGALGQLQGRTQADLTKGAAAYLREMEGLARLTGQTREEMEKQREEANQIEIFYSTVAQMGEAQQKEMYATFNQLKSIDPTGRLALGYANSVSGLVGASEEAGQLFMATNGEILNLIEAQKKGQITNAQFIDQLGQATKQTEQTRLSLGGLGAAQDVYGSNLALANLQNKKAVEGMADVEKGLDANAAGLDKQTAEQVKLRQSQMSARDSLQGLADTVGKKTTPIMEGFGKVVQTVTGILTGKGPAAGGAQGPAGGAGPSSGKMDYKKEFSGGGGAAPGAATPSGGTAPASGAGPSPDLKLKPGAENRGKSTDVLYSVAEEVHKMLGGDYKYFSGFNDRGGRSKHAEGRAFDLVLNDANKYETVLNQIKGIKGVSFAQFEPKGHVNPNGSISSGDHIHTEVSAANGAILSGPLSGYKPNLTMHGTEAIVPLNSNTATDMSGGDAGIRLEGLMGLLREQMDAQTRVMRDIADYTRKTSQYAGV